ncbi:2-hydroxychromene-2-carboxylate isomerase [Saccharopolyspora elongata]|uniref:2-hydroxychromene-2-carboxylate isomerase n=1 Tax=Saccharopolyspora elongata TaxID=2530387 RepID=A0A4R4YJF1_9PSEU|nr:DsbA family protein [Saccharopolyspora elongata]TDD44129.1 2-hydroxychromene-2-carboxylate isomerase [Saccharopolyspora elongata]
MPRKNSVPRCYFSLRSPYSWLAYRDLVDRHPEVAAAVEWRPFWEPDARSERMLAEAGGSFPYVAMSRAKSLYILQDVRRLTRERGLEPTWPVDRDPVWEVPHLAYFVALDEGLGREFVDRAYRARWQEGRDICDRATMAELAAELGLPPDHVSNAVDDEELRRRGTAALLDIDEDGVFGVPFFVDRFNKFWGVDRLPDFVRSVAGTAAAPVPVAAAELDPGLGGDQGHAGGCG